MASSGIPKHQTKQPNFQLAEAIDRNDQTNFGLSTRPTDFGDEVTAGLRDGVTPWTKFAHRENLTAAAGEQLIIGDNTTNSPEILLSPETFTVTYNNATDGAGTTGALTIAFYYLDSEAKEAVSVHTLGNTGSDVTSFTGYGINRLAVSSNGGATYNTSAITVTSTTSGGVQGYVPALESVTEQAIFHTASNRFGSSKYLWFNALKLSGGGNPRITLKGYAHNRNVDTRFEVFRADIDTQVENSMWLTDPINFRLSPSDILYFVADTDTNGPNVNLRFSLRTYEVGAA